MRICPHIVFIDLHNCESLEHSGINPQITPALNFVKINPVDIVNKFYTQTYPDTYPKSLLVEIKFETHYPKPCINI